MRDFGRGQIVVVAQDDGQAVLFAQALDGLPYGGLGLALAEGGLGQGRRLGAPAGGLQHAAQALPGATLAPTAAADVHRDGVEPGGERRLAAEGRQPAQGGQKRLLGGLVGLVRIVQDRERQPVQGGLVSRHQPFDGRGLAGAAALEPLSQIHVVHSHRLDARQGRALQSCLSQYGGGGGEVPEWGSAPARTMDAGRGSRVPPGYGRHGNALRGKYGYASRGTLRVAEHNAVGTCLPAARR